MNRCPHLVVFLKRDLQCLRPEASLVLIYRPNVAGMKGRVDRAQPVNRTPDLWCGSTIHYHSILFGEERALDRENLREEPCPGSGEGEESPKGRRTDIGVKRKGKR
ncbi:hypothetical protein TNCV_3759891 [Trichonephila clavipes]|nr:hypothetical protein TNCV_3759891 [Trichonephila clavipes]